MQTEAKVASREVVRIDVGTHGEFVDVPMCDQLKPLMEPPGVEIDALPQKTVATNRRTLQRANVRCSFRRVIPPRDHAQRAQLVRYVDARGPLVWRPTHEALPS